jgi:hypothetical protein
MQWLDVSRAGLMDRLTSRYLPKIALFRVKQHFLQSAPQSMICLHEIPQPLFPSGE